MEQTKENNEYERLKLEHRYCNEMELNIQTKETIKQMELDNKLLSDDLKDNQDLIRKTKANITKMVEKILF